MPHFRIVDEDNQPEVNAAFDRARVHIRSAYRRREEGKNYHAIATMYDAIEYGLRWYMLSSDKTPAEDRYYIEKAFTHTGLDKKMIDRIIEIMDDAMDIDEEKVPLPIVNEFFELSERILTHINLYPFDFSILPDEFPGIY